MRHCFKQITGHIQYVPESKGKSVQDVRKALDRIVDEGGEGLVIKHPNSKYCLNERNDCWIKVKPEYMVRSFAFVPVSVQGTDAC